MGVALQNDTQILLLDTPGIFEPKRRLDRAMVAAAWAGTADAELIALVVDAERGLNKRIEEMVDRLKDRREPKILILNKVDATPKERSEEHTSELQSLMRISYAVFCLNKKM